MTMSIPLLIDLYRRAGKPDFSDHRFEGEVPFSDDNRSIIESLRRNGLVRFDELEIDGDTVFESDLLPDTGKTAYFNIKTPSTDSNRFYSTLKDMVDSCQASLSKGKLPEQFYIIDRDYSSGEDDNEKVPELVILEGICRFIRQLSEIAHYHDSKQSNGFHKLVFLQPSDKEQKSSLVIETRVEYSLLKRMSLPDTNILFELSDKAGQNDIHYTEKKSIFYSSLAEFINAFSVEGKSYFSTMLDSWDKLANIYQKNLATYLSGFAFHKAKKEIAEAELKIAEDYSKVVSDITGKLLSIPLSIAVVISIYKTQTPVEAGLLIICLILTSTIVAMSVSNQKRQLVRVKSAKELILTAFKGKKEIYPEELADYIEVMEKELKENEENLESTLCLFFFGSWIPTLIGAYLGYMKFF